MSCRYSVSCYFPVKDFRLTVYAGQSLFGAWRAYREAKRMGGLHFIVEIAL